MKKLLFLAISIILTLSTSAQITKQGDIFKNVTIINNKVCFLKEVQIEKNVSELNYSIIKDWALKNYGKDPFVSSVRVDDKEQTILARSRIELILPPNSQGVREKMVMRFRLDGFFVDDKCVLEISDISYLYDNTKDPRLPRVIRAEEFITDKEIARKDDLQELKVNTRKSTLYFLNTIGKELEGLYGY